MDSFSIGMSGLSAAQKAFDIIGNNIANAATDGYHRQRLNLSPAYSSQIGEVILGGGVDVVGITRMIDNFLEEEMLRQQSLSGQVSQELDTLRTVENAFGELSTGSGLSAAIDEFFNALQDLSAHPTEAIWQNQVVSAAETLADRFRTLGSFLNTLESQIQLEAENTIEQINTLITQTAELNREIKRRAMTGGQTNNLRDQRDQCITELSELVGLETQAQEYGTVNVSIAGIPAVSGTTAFELEVGLITGSSMGVSIAGMYSYNTNVQGGRLGGLISLRNDLISDVHSNLDSLASAIIQQINQYHVQGVGSEGSFTQLTGWSMEDEDLADFDPAVTDGKIYIRVINTSTGTITREEITIDADQGGDTLTTIATAISAITGLTASVSSSKLNILADADYEFDFLPGVLSADTSSMTSPPTISVSGIYTGTTNQTYTGKVITGGNVGNTSGLQIQVRDGASQVVATVNVGSGYAAGDRIEIADGIFISVGAGTLVVDEEFTIEALASSDTSGVLAAAGINTFFSGNTATSMAVCSDIANSPGRVATALGADMTDNANALRMAGIKDQTISSLNSMTAPEFYRWLVANLGQNVLVKERRQENTEVMVQNLASQQSEMSGVNINDEAARMLIFEQMFQAIAKYMNTVQSSMFSLMEII
ncbi:MAG: flagellar hook-associated protein FlgK [Planctomycetota bacterium]|jgi:flagellar hook-associated protein FlgK